MVYVGVRQNNGIQIGDCNRKLSVFLVRFASPPLKHAAIQRHGMPVDVQQVTRARYFASCACKSYFQSGIRPLLLRFARKESSDGAHPVT
jgi:hypothetical protein